MPGGVFTIEELRPLGSADPNAPPTERFEWISGKAGGPKGGARAAPVQHWDIGGQLKTVRTDYPGARVPSEQVLNVRHKDFTLRGNFDDRYNFIGYAVLEKQRFESMCRRGNPVRISFESQVFEGLITDWTFSYRTELDVDYAFTFSNHTSPADDQPVSTAAPVATAPQAYDDAQLVVQSLQAQNRDAPAAAMTGTLRSDVEETLRAIDRDMDTLADQLDTKRGILKPIGDFRRHATLFRMVASNAFNVITGLTAARSDLNVGVRTAMSVLDFEVWSRSLRYHSRLLMGRSTKSARDMDERKLPYPIRFYRPHQGESLYRISRQFYGTPHAWRLIAERNGLHTLTMTGEETLIIPERGEG